jgi:hypothetical protein
MVEKKQSLSFGRKTREFYNRLEAPFGISTQGVGKDLWRLIVTF